MDLPLALIAPDGSQRHVQLSCQPGATAGEVARELAPWVGLTRDRTYELWSLDRNILLDPGREFITSGLLSGELVTLVKHPAPRLQAPLVGVAVSGGEDQGQEFLLAPGRFLIGRSSDCQLRLLDRSVSRNHVELQVALDGSYTLTPRSITNSTSVDDEQIQAACTYSGIHGIQLGNCSLTIFPYGRSQVSANSDGFIPHAPSPRFSQPAVTEEFGLPNPPVPARPQQLPMISSLAPLVLALITFIISRNPLSLLFALLSPVIALLSHWESLSHQTKEHALTLQEWQGHVQNLRNHLRRLLLQERKRLEWLYPATNEVVRWIQNSKSRIWERQPDQADFLRLRAGVGVVSAPWTIKLPSSGPPNLIAEAGRQMADLATVEGAPVCIDLMSHPCVSVRLSSNWIDSSRRSESPLAAVAASLVIQAAGLLSPHDLAITACLHHSAVPDWDWLKWLPHSHTATQINLPRVAVAEDSAATLAGSLEAILAKRKIHQGQHSGSSERPFILVVIDSGTGVSSPRLLQLVRNISPGLGIGLIVVDRQSKKVTAGAAAVLTLTAGHQARLSYPSAGIEKKLKVESVSTGVRSMTGRLMSALIDTRVQSIASDSLPAAVQLVGLSGFRARDDPEAIIRAWHSRGKALAAVVGQAAHSIIEVDLRVDGPHGLVAGTTGSGKSEFLQSLIASFASRHSPQRLTFLLVDYKGGAAFKDCRDLVHTVGLVTDLDGHLVLRVLASLKAEIRYREHLLARFNCRDIVQMEKERTADAPPNLLIVVDEFAALAREMPDFVAGMVDVAQRGRSLGVHMLLATQRPAGVVTDNIRANTNLRIALRVSDVADSMDVIGAPVAAYFERHIPGRAALRVGPSELIPFQAAYVGGCTRPGQKGSAVTVKAWRVDDDVAVFTPPKPTQENADDASAQLSDLVKYVETMNAAALALGIPTPRRPWLPELPDVVDLANDLSLPTASGYIALGKLDDPNLQEQRTLSINLNKCGNFLICGTSGAGKTFFLRTVAAAVGVQDTEPVHIYGIDSSGHALKIIEELPFVGSVVAAVDTERTTRLLQMLRATVDKRSQLLGSHAANDLDELRSRSTELANLPRYLVLVDGLHAFLESYERQEGGKWLDFLVQLMADGRSSGVHFIITADRRSGIPMRFASLLPSVLTLRLATADEYLAAGVSPDALGPAPPAGRALFEGLEVQLASLGSAVTGEQQAIAFKNLAARLQAVGSVVTAPSIRSLPTAIPISDLPAGCIGISGRGLEPYAMPGWQIAGIFGPPKSGRTTALLSFGAACVSLSPERRGLLICDRDLPASAPPWLAHTAIGAEEGARALEELMTVMTQNTALNPVVLIDDLNDLIDSNLDEVLSRFLKQLKTRDSSLFVSGESVSIRQSFTSSVQTIRKARAGLLLVPDVLSDGDIFNLNLPRAAVNWTAGRGYMVSNSEVQLIQMAM